MDTFDDEYAVGRKFEFLAFIFTLASDEVIFGHFYLFAVHKPLKVIVEQLTVNGLYIVEIVLSVRQERGIDTIDEIVVCGE